MKIEKLKFLAIMFLFVGFLSAQLVDGFLDNYILDCDIEGKNVVLVSPNSINWRNESGIWKGFNGISAFGASEKYNFDNAVAGQREFAVRLDQKDDSTIAFFIGNFNDNNSQPKTIEYTYKNATRENILYGFDGVSFDYDEFYFAMGDGGIATIQNGKVSYIFEIGENQPISANEYKISDKIDLAKRVVSVSQAANNKLYALSADGSIWHFSDGWNWAKMISLKLNKDEYPYKLVAIKNNIPFILTTDTTTIGKERLYASSEIIYTGDIAKIAVSNDNSCFYILENNGNLVVRDINGKETESSIKRQKILRNRLDKSNATANLILKDISVSENSLAFASDKGLFYSADEENGIAKETPFEFVNKSVLIKSGLREVYAEPGIITTLENYCTFEYSLAEQDRITIDIYNYNLDFVCRIVENEIRPAATNNGHSTNRQQDRWDGTANNRGGRVVSPGIYYFKITAQKSKKSVVGKVVVARK